VRGVAANGFGPVAIVREGEPTPLLDGVRVVVFNEDNWHARRRLRDLREAKKEESPVGLGVRHVNLGILPTSEGGWENAINTLTDGDGEIGWAHVHENAAVAEVVEKGADVQRKFRELLSKMRGEEWKVALDGNARVKTYAPGVVHMVYDVKIWKENAIYM